MPISNGERRDASERQAPRDDVVDGAVNDGGQNARHRHPREHVRGWVVFACVMVGFVALDVALSYLLLTYGAESEAVWSSYHQAADQTIDTVIVGSSYAAHAIDPSALDSELGSSSWMLASPAQSLTGSYSAIKTAIEDHHIKRAIIGIGNDTMFEADWANSAVVGTLGKMQGESLSQKAEDVATLVTEADFIGSYKSLGILFPWTMGTSGFSRTAVADNIHRRLTVGNALEASFGTLPGWQYQGQGYGNGTTELDPVTAGNVWGSPLDSYTWNADSQTWEAPKKGKGLEYTQANIDELQKMVELCCQNGVTPYVVVVPQESYFTLSYGAMFAQDKAELKTMVENAGGRWIDYSMVRSGHFAPSNNQWLDPKGHLNFKGAAYYGAVLGADVLRLEQGESISSDFYAYDQIDELAATFPGVNVVSVKAVVLPEGTVRAYAQAVTPPSTPVEYRFDLLDSQGNVLYETDYAEEQYQTLPFDTDQILSVRAYARTKGADVPFERTAEIQINA